MAWRRLRGCLNRPSLIGPALAPGAPRCGGVRPRPRDESAIVAWSLHRRSSNQHVHAAGKR
eukprot:14592049-Alexandrium_andersonii.AAC.1